MRIHKSRPGHFAAVPNSTACDRQLSYAARGLLVELLSRKDGWDTTADKLADKARRDRGVDGEGRRAMRRLFSELREAGYLKQTVSRGSDGRFVTETHVYDQPQ